MKKLITLVAIALAFFVQTPAQAQFVNKSLATNTPAMDTVSNAATVSHNVEIKGNLATVTFQLDAYKQSGTTAGYWIRNVSANGIKYVPLDTTVLVDGTTKSYKKEYTGNHYRYWQIQVVQTGSSVTAYDPWILTW